MRDNAILFTLTLTLAFVVHKVSHAYDWSAMGVYGGGIFAGTLVMAVYAALHWNDGKLTR